MSPKPFEMTLRQLRRVVTLMSLEQELTYEGLLEGLPTREMNRRIIAGLVQRARKRYGHEPFVVEPAERPIEYEGKYPLGDPAALPGVVCTARFRSNQTGRSQDPLKDFDYSELVVIWFQSDFAVALSDETKQAISQIDWLKLARDDTY